MEGNAFKYTLNLRAQSMMIHFQADEKGATLRASEVKPKLDKYLLKRKPDLDKYKRDKTNALDYKMKIIAENNGLTNSEGKETPYDLYYGDIEKGIQRDCRVEILCFNADLMKAIKTYSSDFFFSHNFGSMQDKGFGSFVPDEFIKKSKNLDDEQIEKIGEALRSAAGAKNFYCVKFNDKIQKDILFKFIKVFYKIMKSGYNQGNTYVKSYLFKYMKEKHNVDNEKAWMKQKKIAPSIYDESKPTYSQEWKKSREENTRQLDARYIRALLGITGNMWFKMNRGGMIVSISNENIRRSESPIFFKVVLNYIFIVANRVPDELYGSTFKFKGKGKEEWKSGSIKVPSNDFDIDDFLNDYFEYFMKPENEEINKVLENEGLIVKEINKVLENEGLIVKERRIFESKKIKKGDN